VKVIKTLFVAADPMNGQSDTVDLCGHYHGGRNGYSMPLHPEWICEESAEKGLYPYMHVLLFADSIVLCFGHHGSNQRLTTNACSVFVSNRSVCFVNAVQYIPQFTVTIYAYTPEHGGVLWCRV